MIKKIVGLTKHPAPIALIGAGGIGKTSTALAVLHDEEIKQRFGEHRRFIRCDRFPPSLAHFLRHLSKVIGAGIEDPEDLAILRPFLSSRDMFIVLDNVESILQGASAEEIYAAVEELSQLGNICLCITSRISAFPSNCKWLDIRTLSREAACDTFYRIYQHGKRSDLITNILKQLDFHPLSVTLLATVARHNKWDTDRLASEWDERHTDMLQIEPNKSLAATIELSLSSSAFRELGRNARDLLGVVAFFPQGVCENNVDWLFPTIANRKSIFDKLCVLSLAYRRNGFITMLAPFRDYLSPKNPTSAPLLCSIKDRYFTRLSVDIRPGRPGFEEARWITSEDANVEHLLDVFTTVGVTSDGACANLFEHAEHLFGVFTPTDGTSGGVWGACAGFMKHLVWHKPRPIALGPKIERLPDDHPFKLECLFQLSRLFHKAGNYTESKRLLTYTSELSQERGDDHQLIRVLRHLSRVHLSMHLHKEGIQQAEEASEISERLGDTVGRAQCLIELAWLLSCDKQLDAAEEAASRAIDLLLEKGEQFHVCHCHHVLGRIYHSKGDTEKAIHHFEVAIGIASPFNWSNLLFSIYFSLADLFSDEGRFGDARTHAEHAKSHAVKSHDTYLLAHAMWLKAGLWHKQRSLKKARSEALRAVDAFEKLGASNDVGGVRELLRRIDLDT